MEPFSFTFGGKNSKDFGILGTGYDFLMPNKRERKQQIPFRNGAYDYGARYYNERELRVRCIWAAQALEAMTRAYIREVAYWLSTKSQIVFPEEPDKYYVGEIYDANELITHYDYAKEGYPANDGEFELSFICDPFAYGHQVTLPITGGENSISYAGTAETPTLIILKNLNSYAVSGITIVAARGIN